LDATLPIPVQGLPLQLPDPAIQRDQNQAKADVYVCQQIKQQAQQQGGRLSLQSNYKYIFFYLIVVLFFHNFKLKTWLTELM
jgi:hypothetical protein